MKLKINVQLPLLEQPDMSMALSKEVYVCNSHHYHGQKDQQNHPEETKQKHLKN
jgi:hypothetical protein